MTVLIIPKEPEKPGLKGVSPFSLLSTKRGGIEDPKILRGIGGGCDEEALRVIKKARFTPGKQRGNPVRVQVAQTIYFRLQD